MQDAEITVKDQARYWDQWWWHRAAPVAAAITVVTALLTTMVCQIAAYLLL